jgi:hypothetical protein
LPQLSFSIVIFDIVTSVGGIVNSAPRAFMRCVCKTERSGRV